MKVDEFKALYGEDYKEVKNISESRVLEIVDACFHAFASSFRFDAKEMAEGILREYESDDATDDITDNTTDSFSHT